MKGERPLPAAARAVLNGDRRTLARLITSVENQDPKVRPILRALYPRTGRARVIGITGPLGVGKSSLINALLKRLRSQGTRVGVVAVDPSSPFSGGSVLGDRIRLDISTGDDGVFVRSMASRGHSGGVAAATRDVTRLLDAAGFQIVLVETVGSGQVDVEIREVATTTLVVLVPHLGDDVQTLKAGLFEIADVFCINKSDLAGAEAAEKDIAELVALAPPREGWRPVVTRASAQESTGIDALWTALEAHEEYLDTSGIRVAKERQRLADEVVGIVRERIGEELAQRLERDPGLKALLDQVLLRQIDPQAAADALYANHRRAA